MKNTFSLAIAIIIMFLLTGCGQTVQPPLYNWGNYVKSSSDYGMNGHNKEVLEKHLLELEKIITESNEKDQRVAPGIYAEYAQILFETNKKEKANKYFLLEKTTYPISSQFIDRVLTKLYGVQK
jgi:hypothetical protein